MIGIGLGFVKGGGAAAAEPWFADLQNSEASSGSATATADVTAHVKGAWTEIIASTAADCSTLMITVTDVASSGVLTSTLLDIGIGASGSESVIIPDVGVAGAGTNDGITFTVPVRCPSGSRIAARIQSVVTGGKTATVGVKAYSWGDYLLSPTSVDIYGTSTGTSDATAGSAGYVQIAASTSTAYQALILVPCQASLATSNVTVTSRIGIGASGSEVAYGKWIQTWNTIEACYQRFSGPDVLGGDVPSGTRLSWSNDASGNEFRYGASIIGVPYP